MTLRQLAIKHHGEAIEYVDNALKLSRDTVDFLEGQIEKAESAENYEAFEKLAHRLNYEFSHLENLNEQREYINEIYNT